MSEIVALVGLMVEIERQIKLQYLASKEQLPFYPTVL